MTYPLRSHEEAAAALLPGIAARGQGAAWFAAVFGDLGRLDEDVAGIYEALVDIEMATGPGLDIAGDQVGERRQGLADHEYRRIIAGRRIAQNAVVPRRVWAGWVALTGSDGGRLVNMPPASIALWGPITFAPTSAWLKRAGQVVSALTASGIYASAAVTPPGTAHFDELPGYDAGLYAFDLPVHGYP